MERMSLRMEVSPPHNKRKWMILPGRNKFCCNGRVIMSHQIGVFYFTLALIVGTMVLFFGWDAPFLSVNLSPIIPVLAALFLSFVLVNLLKTAFSDPGIVPRAEEAESAEIERSINARPIGNCGNYFPPPRTKEVIINGQLVKLKYCFTCKIFRPPRSSHCSICDNCILNFDHHCPWVGNCVGLRNYRHFYFFIVSLSFLVVYIFVCVNLHIFLMSKNELTFLAAIEKSPTSLVVGLVCFLSIWSILGLAGFHTYLLASNQTTNEDIKGVFSPRRRQSTPNPYSVGSMLGNFFRTVCAPEPPSLLDRRGWMKPDKVVVIPTQLIRLSQNADSNPQQEKNVPNNWTGNSPENAAYGSTISSIVNVISIEN